MDEDLSRRAKLLEERIRGSDSALRASPLTRRHQQEEAHNGGLFGGPRVYTENFEERRLVLVDRYARAWGENLNTEFFSGTCFALLAGTEGWPSWSGRAPPPGTPVSGRPRCDLFLRTRR